VAKPIKWSLIPKSSSGINDNKNTQNGQVLVLALTATAVMLIFSVGLITFATNGYRNSSSSYKKAEAINLAEAGVEKAIFELNLNSGYTGTGGTPITLTNGQLEITVSGSGNTRTITSTGYVPQKTNYKSKKIVKISLSNTNNTTSSVFQYTAQAGSGSITMANNSSINFKAASNANISGGNGSQINGDAYAVGTISTPPAVSGQRQQNQPLLQIPAMDYDYWRNLAAAGGTQNGTYNISGNVNLGPKRINGNVTMSNNSNLTLTGPVYITGNFSTGNNTTIKPSDSLGSDGTVMLVDGTITFSNGVTVSPNNANPKGYILFATPSTSNNAVTIGNNGSIGPIFAPNGRVTVSNNATNTCLIAKTVSLSNNATVTYDSRFATMQYTGLITAILGPFTATTGTWQETSN